MIPDSEPLEGTPDAEPLPGWPHKPIAAAAAATMVGSLPMFVTAAMSVQLGRDLGIGTVQIGTAMASFFGAQALTSMYLGRLADRFGPIPSLRLATITATIAAWWIAVLSRDFVTLTVGLVLAGLAAALVQPAANGLLIATVRPERLGIAFGLKQSAPPSATMLAGIAVPTIALTIGWRWAYVLAGALAAMVGLLLLRDLSVSRERKVHSRRRKLQPLADPRALAGLAIAFGVAFAASSAVLGFYVTSAVASGASEASAGIVYGVASASAISTRLLAGWACDRFQWAPLRFSAILLAAGSAGILSLATGHHNMMILGAIIAIAGSWGFPGLFWLALVRAYPGTPGRVTGAMAPSAIGGVLGPIGFGMIVTGVGFSLAWIVTAVFAATGASIMLVRSRSFDL